MPDSRYKFDINSNIYLDSVNKEILKVDSILKQVLCILYVQSFRIDFTITPKTI